MASNGRPNGRGKDGRKLPAKIRPDGFLQGRTPTLTPEVIEEARKWLRGGCFEKHVAAALGISLDTWNHWKAQGKVYAERLAAGEWESFDDVPRNGQLYMAFRQTCEEGKATAINASVLRVRKLGESNWTALKWWLQVRDPDTFGQQGMLGLDVSGTVGVRLTGDEKERVESEIEAAFGED